MIAGSSAVESKVPEGVIPLLPAPKKPKMLRKTQRKKYCQIITLREGKHESARKTEIPASAKDNRIANVILSSKLRTLLEKQIDTYADSNVVVSPEELVRLANAVERTAQVSYRAHGDQPGAGEGLPPVNQSNRTSIGAVVIGGGQTGDSLGNILDQVGSAAKRAQAPIPVNEPKSR